MPYAPIARIVVRYGVGLTLGHEAAEAVLADGDVMQLATQAVAWAAVMIGVLTEVAYAWAKRYGGET
jgi:hypothetical protein